MLDRLTKESFERFVGQEYRLVLGQETLRVELTEVAESKIAFLHEGPYPERSPFSVIFRFPLTPFLGQGTYTLEHGEMGTIEGLFMTPVGRDDKGLYYQAVFA